MSISVDLWPQPAVKITSTTSTHPRLAPLCSRFLQNSPCLTELFKAVYFPSVYTIFRLIFFSLFPCLFFLFWKRKYGFIKAQGLSITLYRALFLSINLPDFFFFTWCSELVIRLWLLMPPDTNPVHYSPTYKIMTYPPPTLWDLPGPWSRLNASFMGHPFISHTASLPPENTPVYAVTPQTQTQNSPNREREANGLYFSFLRVNRLVIYHGINMPDMFMKAVISRSKKFPKES